MAESVDFSIHETMIRLCARFGLGKLIDPPTPVMGGLLNRLYRIRASEGHFAIKLLNPDVMKRPDAWDNFVLSEKIARAVAQSGLPAVPARTLNDEPVQIIDGFYFMVFDWVEGTALPPVAAKPEQCRIMGSMLAGIHQLNLALPEAAAPRKPVDYDWKALLAKGAEHGASWARAVDSTLPELLEWSRTSQMAHEALSRKLVFSHCDLDQKNVLWKDEQSPVLIDWEASGLINPIQELVDLALNWGGLLAGETDGSAFLSVIQGYLDSSGSITANWRDAINGGLDGKLGWLAYNMRRSLGEEISEADEQELGTREAVQCLESLRETSRNVELWCRWLEAL